MNLPPTASNSATSLIIFATLLIALSPLVTRSQSSLFNIPNAEVLGKNERYVEIDFDSHFDKYRRGGFQSYGVVGVFGVGKRVEVGMNGYLLRDEDGVHPFQLQPNIKFKVYESETLGLSAAVGGIAYIPVSKRVGTDAFASLYAVARKEFRNKWTPVFTGGAYHLVGTGPDSGSKRGFLVGIEQPIHSRVNFIADWNSGKNDLGYAAAGIGLTLTKRSYLYSAYYFGNQGRGNNSLGIYYVRSF
ncbi:MAG: hypothetical protein ABIR33_04355 [Pyrinomonadaceae bacterium]